MSQERAINDTMPAPYLPVASPARWAYAACEQITRAKSRSFYLSSALLPEEQRLAIRALYAWCRLSDDLVDVPEPGAGLSLDAWDVMSRNPAPTARHPVLWAWAETRRKFGIPQDLMDELLQGIRMDLTIFRYTTFQDLWLYCYRVAATVGLMSMHIIGFTGGEKATEAAITLGVALQVTNILRDVGEDALRGRIYIPLEDLQSFGVAQEDILSGKQSPEFKQLMAFQIDRAHALYDTSLPGIAYLDAKGRLAVAAAAQSYRGILGKIVENEYDVFNFRAHLNTWEKLRLLPELWWYVRKMKNFV